MPRLIILAASVSLAFLTICSTCISATPQSDLAAPKASPIVSTDGDSAILWPSSEAPSRIVAGGLLTP